MPAKKKGTGTAATATGRRFWLVKSEPDVFSFDDLMNAADRTTQWNGVRNFVARNHLKDMKAGDRVFFYHSGAAPAVVGICEVVKEGYPDDTAFDSKSEGYDPKSTRDKSSWFMVDLRAVERLPRPVTLAEIRKRTELAQMALVRVGRLSVSPVTPTEWKTVLEMTQS